MTPVHRKALSVDNEVRRLRVGLDLCTIGLAAWCARTVADDSYLRSPNLDGSGGAAAHVDVDGEGHVIEPETGDKDTPVEAAAFTRPDPLVPHAHAYLQAVEKGNVAAMVRHASVICRDIPPAQRVDPCRKCAKPIEVTKDARNGECGPCRKGAQRERERVA